MNFRKTKIICIGKRLVVGKYLVEDCLVPEASENSSVLAVVISCVLLLVLRALCYFLNRLILGQENMQILEIIQRLQDNNLLWCGFILTTCFVACFQM